MLRRVSCREAEPVWQGDMYCSYAVSVINGLYPEKFSFERQHLAGQQIILMLRTRQSREYVNST